MNLKYQKELNQFDVATLSEENQINYSTLLYEIDLNLERIALEKEWIKGKYKIQKTRIYDEKLGKQWYAYFLKRWVDKNFTPDAAFEFGLAEIDKAKARINSLQKSMGLESIAFKKQWEDEKYLISEKKSC